MDWTLIKTRDEISGTIWFKDGRKDYRLFVVQQSGGWYRFFILEKGVERGHGHIVGEENAKIAVVEREKTLP